MYTVYPDFWPAAADSLPVLRHMVEETGSCIFNPDKKRTQTQLKPTHAFYHAFEAALVDRGLVRGRVLQDMFVLQSYAGCQQQPFHYDFDPKVRQAHRKKPQGVMLALEDGTTLDFLDRKETLCAGDLLVFEGDCVHAGSAYATNNTRVHCYLDSCTHPREANKTWLYTLS